MITLKRFLASCTLGLGLYGVGMIAAPPASAAEAGCTVSVTCDTTGKCSLTVTCPLAT